jgi:hypothetical protein
MDSVHGFLSKVAFLGALFMLALLIAYLAQ